MKKSILTLAVLASMSSMSVMAEEAAAATEAEMDNMSDPTSVYTSLGVSYGNTGLNFNGMLMLNSSATQKSGILWDANDVLDENNYSAKEINVMLPERDVSKTNFRVRWGTINTTNGLGWSIDAVIAEHPYYGQMSVVQTGPIATLPITDNWLVFPIIYMGGVIVENTDLDGYDMEMGPGGAPVPVGSSSSGVEIASTILTGMVYTRYSITDDLWVLASYSHTDDIQGKEWGTGNGIHGLGLAKQMYDVKIGYQISDTQNVTLYWGGDDASSSNSSDEFTVGYNYAF